MTTPEPLSAENRKLVDDVFHEGFDPDCAISAEELNTLLNACRRRTPRKEGPRTDSPGDGVELVERLRAPSNDGPFDPKATYATKPRALLDEAAAFITRKAVEVERMRGALEEIVREVDDSAEDGRAADCTLALYNIASRALDTEGGGEG